MSLYTCTVLFLNRGGTSVSFNLIILYDSIDEGSAIARPLQREKPREYIKCANEIRTRNPSVRTVQDHTDVGFISFLKYRANNE
jgi:hypothetical protein